MFSDEETTSEEMRSEDEIVEDMTWVSLLYRLEGLLDNLNKECVIIHTYKQCIQKLDVCDDIQNQIFEYIYPITEYENNCKIINEYNLVREMYD